MKRVLFVVPHRPGRSPSQRFRFEQYLDFLRQNGYTCEFSFLLNEKDDRTFYSYGNYPAKAWIVCKSFMTRLRDVLRASRYDIIFVQREAFMLGTALFEVLFGRSEAKLVFDFDDAIWLPDTSVANQSLAWLKRPSKTNRILSAADMIFAGNRNLAGYAAQYNSRVLLIPSTVDTDLYKRIDLPERDGRLCLGWFGSLTTIKHFITAVPVLERLYDKYGERICFKVVGDGTYEHPGLGIRGIAWRRDDEVRELSGIDIGLMPLPDDPWTRGKCGLKGLLYMAMETATVMSPVGVNAEIITDGVNGFLAGTEEEWFDKLSLLIENQDLRRRLALNGRQTVVEWYSVEANKNKYLHAFNELTQP